MIVDENGLIDLGISSFGSAWPFLFHFIHFIKFLFILSYHNEILFSIFYLQILWNVSVFRITELMTLIYAGTHQMPLAMLSLTPWSLLAF